MNTIIFVYNADSSFFAQVSDFAKKIIKPASYDCNLCMVTYGSLGMKGEWKEFVESRPEAKVYLHRDEFIAQYPQYKETSLPVIFLKKESEDPLSLLVSREEINAITDVKEMIKLVGERLA